MNLLQLRHLYKIKKSYQRSCKDTFNLIFELGRYGSISEPIKFEIDESELAIFHQNRLRLNGKLINNLMNKLETEQAQLKSMNVAIESIYKPYRLFFIKISKIVGSIIAAVLIGVLIYYFTTTNIIFNNE